MRLNDKPKRESSETEIVQDARAHFSSTSMVTKVTSYDTMEERPPDYDEIPLNVFCTNVRRYAQEVSDVISFDGFRYLFEEGLSFFERLLWLCIVVSSIIAFFFIIVIIHQINSKNPIIVSFSHFEHSNEEILFPAVTICPQPIKTDNLEYRSLVCESKLDLNETFPDFLERDFGEKLEEIAPNLEDIMVNCSFEEQDLQCAEIFKPTSTKFGLCYSFNMLSPGDIFRYIEPENSSSLRLRRPAGSGVRNSLRILLKQKESELDSECGFGISGFKLTLHNASEIPNFELHYLMVSLNSQTSIALLPTAFNNSNVIKDYTPEWRNCYYRHEKYLKFYEFYSIENCINECQTNFTLKMCGCVAFYMPWDDKMPICGVSKMDCVTQSKRVFELELEAEKNNCDCKMFCTEISFDVDFSMISKNFSVGKDSDEFGFTEVNIFLKNEHILVLERIEFYGVADIMANVGGLLNFFIGSSFITLAEIIYALTLKIICNKIIYGPWAGPASIEYNFILQ